MAKPKAKQKPTENGAQPQVQVTQVPHIFNAELLARLQGIDAKLGEIVRLLSKES